MLFDAHTHLNFEKYTDEERRSLAAGIEASEVAFIVDVADCVDSARQALTDSHDYPWCYAAVGIHPDHASDYEGIAGDDPDKRREIGAFNVEQAKNFDQAHSAAALEEGYRQLLDF